LGSCTANALCGAVVYVIPSLIGSRLFLYYNERKIERTIPTDSGAYIHDGITALKTYGICLETQWPYNIAKFAVAPTAQCYTSAAQHKALTVASVPINLGSMKAVLAGGFPITIGFTVYDSFETAAVARTGIVPMPAKSERVLGGHAVLIVGFDDSRSWFIVRNSWGTGWGDKGYFYIPYAYFTNPTLVSDLWTISRVQA
jgi:C1A family cysteine protease